MMKVKKPRARKRRMRWRWKALRSLTLSWRKKVKSDVGFISLKDSLVDFDTSLRSILLA